LPGCAYSAAFIEEGRMKQGYRFVDCDMHIMEPPDLFDKYLDPAFKHRVTSAMRRSDGGPTGMRGRPSWFFDGAPTSNDGNISQYNRIRGPLVSKRANTTVMFAVERGYDAEAQVIGMEMEGIDIAVLFPTAGLNFLARDNMDPQFSAAICRAYNDWLHDFVQHSPDQLKMAAMLPIHDVNLACQELYRCVKEYGAVGAFVRPNYVNGRYWHSTYWDGLYNLLQDLEVPLCFHEGTGSHYSTIEPRFGENRFMRHVASHSTEMQLALIALMLGGIFEFYPRLKVAFLEAQSWWVPGLLGRIEWDMRQHHDSDAPYLKLTPFEYWQRNCFSAIESGEREVGATVELLGGADNICVSSDFPHFDSSFPEVSTRVLTNASITPEIGGKILSGGARLYGFNDDDFDKAAAAARRRDNVAPARA
jgi:predicted TIM-barrel fold metal-dependent hydrolase